MIGGGEGSQERQEGKGGVMDDKEGEEIMMMMRIWEWRWHRS